MAYTIAGPNTGDSASILTGDIRQLWQKGVEVWEQTTDFWAPMEGGSNAIIETVTDVSKGRGQKITFTQMAGLYDEPKLGDELFEESADFESIILNHYDLSVDYLRHGVRYTERMEEVMGMRGEIVAGVPRELGKWLGRQKSEKMFMAFLHKGATTNHIFANNAANADALTDSDTIKWDDIVAGRTQLERLNGQPAKVGSDKNGNAINRYVAVATTDALFGFEVNDLKTLLSSGSTDTLGAQNLLWQGGFHDIRGTMIKKYNPIDHDGIGAIGSPLLPKATLGCDTANGFAAVGTAHGDTSLTANRIYGGGTAANGVLTTKLYFKYFPLYQFKFLYGETLTLANSLYGSGEFFVAIVNPPNATTDPGKVGFYIASANNGNLLTVAHPFTAAGNAASGGTINGTTVTAGNGDNATFGFAAGFNFDTTKHTNHHTVGSAIYLCNSSGVYLGHTLLLGKQAARRGYGKHRNTRTDDDHEGGFVRDIFITTVFGQEVCKDAAGRIPGYLTLTHAVELAGVPYAGV
jgi:hypothetical protein